MRLNASLRFLQNISYSPSWWRLFTFLIWVNLFCSFVHLLYINNFVPLTQSMLVCVRGQVLMSQAALNIPWASLYQLRGLSNPSITDVLYGDTFRQRNIINRQMKCYINVKLREKKLWLSHKKILKCIVSHGRKGTTLPPAARCSQNLFLLFFLLPLNILWTTWKRFLECFRER